MAEMTKYKIHCWHSLAKKTHPHTLTVKRHFLLVTAAVCREPQLTVRISHDGETSSRAGKAWIDMNTSPCSSCGSPGGGVLVFGHGAPVQNSQCCTPHHTV